MTMGGWSNGTQRRIIVVVGTAFSGLFFYSGSPGTGNLIGSWTAQSGTDPYGNHYVAGLATYYSDGRVALTIGYTALGGQQLALLADSASPTPAQIEMATDWNNNDQAFIQALDDGGGLTAVIVQNIIAAGWFCSPLAAIDPNNAAVAETWHTIAGGVGYQNGWHDNGAGYSVGRYKLSVETHRVWLDGTIAPGTFTNGTVIFQLPAGYRPAASLRYVLQTDNAGTSMFEIDIGAAGNVIVTSIVGSTPGFVSLTGFSFPLD